MIQTNAPIPYTNVDKAIPMFLLGGLARSGKSTITEALERDGWVIMDNSRYLDIMTLRYYGLSVNRYNLKALRNKTVTVGGLSARDAKIEVCAMIERNQGKYHGMIEPLVKHGFDIYRHRSCFFDNKPKGIVLVFFDRREADLLLKAIEDNCTQDYTVLKSLYLTRDDQLTAEADKRELEGIPINNNGSVANTLNLIYANLYR
jgi:hypothetical protein